MLISNSVQVGAIVKRNRMRLKLTQGELADKAGLSRRLINDVESGQAKNIGLNRLLNILDALEVPLFIEGAQEQDPLPDYVKNVQDRLVEVGNSAWDFYKKASGPHVG